MLILLAFLHFADKWRVDIRYGIREVIFSNSVLQPEVLPTWLPFLKFFVISVWSITIGIQYRFVPYGLRITNDNTFIQVSVTYNKLYVYTWTIGCRYS